MKNEPNEGAIVVQEGKTPQDMIRFAVQSGADLEKLEKVLELQMRWEANEAKKAYTDDMVQVHNKIPSVAKSLRNNQTNSNYASLDQIICRTKEIYTAHGFSISFYEGIAAQPENMRICADVVHKLGHKESFFYDVPLDGVGIKGNANMTKIHAKASSTSYGRRYLLCMILNIPTGDDNDGNGSSQVIDQKQLGKLRDMMADKDVKEAQFCLYLKVDALESLPKSKYEQAYKALEAKVKK